LYRYTAVSREAIQRKADEVAALRTKIAKLAESERRNAGPGGDAAMLAGVRRKAVEYKARLATAEAAHARINSEVKFKEGSGKKSFKF
jgi:hypothetical protein